MLVYFVCYINIFILKFDNINDQFNAKSKTAYYLPLYFMYLKKILTPLQMFKIWGLSRIQSYMHYYRSHFQKQ